MGQIIKNYVFIFIIPFLAGAAVRFLFRRTKRAYLFTLVFIAFAVIGWIVAYGISTHGSEFYGLIALQTTSAAAGTLLIGLITQLKRNR